MNPEWSPLVKARLVSRMRVRCPAWALTTSSRSLRSSFERDPAAARRSKGMFPLRGESEAGVLWPSAPEGPGGLPGVGALTRPRSRCRCRGVAEFGFLFRDLEACRWCSLGRGLLNDCSALASDRRPRRCRQGIYLTIASSHNHGGSSLQNPVDYLSGGGSSSRALARHLGRDPA